MRLDRFLSNMGKGSRRDVKALIARGAVFVGSDVARSPEQKIDPDRDPIFVFGEKVRYQKERTLMMHKPGGIVSATEDPREKTVLDLLSEEDRRFPFFPAGRLDKDTTGFLLLTTDGQLAHSLLSPKKHVDKTYEALLNLPADEADKRAFQSGIALGNGESTRPAELIFGPADGARCTVVLREGKYHQVKRMFAARGKKVLALRRVAIGGLFLDETLKEGEYRELTNEEIYLLCSGKGE